MAIDYPTALDSFTDKQDNVDVVQAVDINDVQDACMALEEKVGIDGSDVTTSHDYKISILEGHLENIVFAKDYDSFADAVSDIGTSDATTLITSTSLTLTANVTVSGNINVIALEGTSFSGAYTLTFNGPFQAGLYQVFDSDVTVKFGSGAINNIYPEWWGARSIGATDDTSAIQSAVDSISDIGGTIVFSTGTYKITTSKTIPSSVKIKVEKGAILYTDRSIRTTDYKWTQSTKAQLVEDCEDAWNESVDEDVTSSADTGDYKMGSASVKLVVGDGVAAGDILATEAITSLDISGYTYIKLWIKSSVATADGDLQLLLDDTANCASPLETIDVPALSIDTWTQVELPLANRSNDTAIISVGLKYAVDIGTCTIHIDDLQATSPYEYYLEAAAGGDPGISEPACCTENGSELTEGTAGTLAVGEWDWADNDSLGYNTVYIRLSDNGDPDGKATDYVKAGYKLTLNGPFSAGLYQVFAGDGSVSFGDVTVKEAYPEWWGENVTPGTTDMSTYVEDAIIALSTNGGTVHFQPQIYLLGDVILKSHVNLKGSGWNTLLKKKSDATFVLTAIGSSGSISGNVCNFIISNMCIEGLSVDSGFSEFDYMINMKGVSDVLIERCKLTAFEGDAIYLGDSDAGTERHNQRVIIKNNYFDGVNKENRQAISVIDGDTIHIEGNYFTRCTKDTMPSVINIEPNLQTYTVIKNILIKDNTFYDNGRSAINVYLPNDQATLDTASRSIIVENNYIDGFGGSGIKFLQTGTPSSSTIPNVVIVRNNFVINGYVGLTIVGMKGIVIENNFIQDMDMQNFIGDSDGGNVDVVIKNNGFFNISNRGLSIYKVENLLIDGNTFSDCDPVGIRFEGVTSSERVSIINNTFLSPTLVMTTAITRNINHTFSSAENYYSNNDLGGIPNSEMDTFVIATFTDGDTTPSVAGGEVFKTSNSSATTITDFDDGVAGQIIKIIFGDNNTTIDFTGTNLWGNTGTDWSPKAQDWMEAVFDGTRWHCAVHDCTA